MYAEAKFHLQIIALLVDIAFEPKKEASCQQSKLFLGQRVYPVAWDAELIQMTSPPVGIIMLDARDRHGCPALLRPLPRDHAKPDRPVAWVQRGFQ